MSNTEKAAQVIYDTLSGKYGDFRFPTDAGEALAEAGLLMPDLPEMEERYGTVMNDWVRVDDDGALWIRYGVDDSPLTQTEARELALSLLAAADHAEEESWR